MFYDEFACRGRVARCREGASLGRRVFSPTRAFAPNGRADLAFSLRPDTTAIAKPVNDAAVLGAQNADAMGRKPRVRHQAFEFGKKFSAHADRIHAFACGSIHETTCTQSSTLGATKCA